MKESNKERLAFLVIFCVGIISVFFYAYNLGTINATYSNEPLKDCIASYNDCAERYNAIVYKVNGVDYSLRLVPKNFTIEENNG